jgi:membrane protease YdiL (CAAX protease family)
MKKIKKATLIVMIIMTILSFTNLFGLNMAGLSVIIGVVYFFVNKIKTKQSNEESGFDIKKVFVSLKNKKIWFWMLMPLIMDAVSITLGVLFLPEYIQYEITRAGEFVSFEIGIVSLFEFAFLALGEEIAWRAFFQKELNKIISIIPVLLISSVLFALGHFTVIAGFSTVIVIYNVFFVCINSVLYGVIAHKTKNAWVSAISHFAANVFSVIVMMFL